MKFIHVDPKAIRTNGQDGKFRPTVVLIIDGLKQFGHGIEILGPSKVVYKPNKPMGGAHVWIETTASVNLIIKVNGRKRKRLIK